MISKLIQYIGSCSSQEMTDAQIELLRETCRYKRFKKRQYFLQDGDVCKYFGFIISGAMRQYSICEKGNEHIVYMGVENGWVGDRESYVTLKPSIYNIEAWEDTEVIMLTRADKLKLMHHIPAFEEAMLAMYEMDAIATQKRLNASLSMAAEQLYEYFTQSYPLFCQRFPLTFIASYLGVTKETISRVRRSALVRN